MLPYFCMKIYQKTSYFYEKNIIVYYDSKNVVFSSKHKPWRGMSHKFLCMNIIFIIFLTILHKKKENKMSIRKGEVYHGCIY